MWKNQFYAVLCFIFLVAELAHLVKAETVPAQDAVEISWLVELEPDDGHRQTAQLRFKRDAIIGKSENEKQPKILLFHVHSDIKFRYSRTLVTSKVENPKENVKSQEVLFSAVLPETAFISQFSIEVDGKQYRAKVLPKQEASERYEQAKRGHRTAGLVELNTRFSNVFTVNVNVEPQGSIIFHLAYEELLRRRLGSYEHVTNINPAQVTSTPILDHKISLNIEDTRDLVDVGASKICNNLKMENDVGGVTVRESSTKASISWTVSKEDQKRFNKKGNSCQLVVHFDVERNNKNDTGEILISQGYFVHFFAKDDLPPIPQHLVFILDISRSMLGEKMEQMKKAQIQILSELRETDYFSIIIFDHEIELWTWSRPKSCEYQPLAATRKNLGEAKQYIKRLEPRGSTNIHRALMEGLTITKRISESEPECPNNMPSNLKPLIIFLTDGETSVGVTNQGRILESIRERNRFLKVPILSLGFGKDVDFPFLKKLSLQNHGFARKIYEGSDASLQIRNFYREVSSLLLTDVKFRYTSMTLEISDLTKTKFSQYFGGTDIVVAGKLDTTNICDPSDSSLKNLEELLKANVTGGGDEMMKWLDIPANLVGPIGATCGQSDREWNAELATPDDRFLEALWAYLTISQLIDNEDVRGNKKALKLALKYGFVTPLTSLLVVTPETHQQSRNATDNDDNGKNDYVDPMAPIIYSNYHPTSFGGVAMSNQAVIFVLVFTARFVSVVSQN